MSAVASGEGGTPLQARFAALARVVLRPASRYQRSIRITFLSAGRPICLNTSLTSSVAHYRPDGCFMR